MNKLVKPALLVIGACLYAKVLQASPIEGEWEGNLKLAPNMTLPLVLRLSNDNDEWSAELDSPVQSALGMEMSKLEIDVNELVFELDTIGVHYSGSYDPSTDTIDGTFIQGKPMPLTFVREFKREIPTTIAIDSMEQIVGSWSGRIQSIKLPFIMNVEFVDGTYKATAESPFQGGIPIEISRLELTKGKLHLDIDELDVSYTAEISSDSKALSGQFSQGSLSSTLVLDKQLQLTSNN